MRAWWQGRIFPAIGLLLLLALPAHAQSDAASYQPPPSSGQSESRPPQPTTSADQRSTAESHASAAAPPENPSAAPENKANASEDNSSQENQNPASDWWLVTWTGWLFAATVALSVFAFGQVLLFWWQLSIIRAGLADTKKAADAAEAGAKATQDAVEQSQDTAKRQLRAYVLGSGCSITLNTEAEDGFTIRVAATNYGATPAHDVTMWMGIRFRSLPLTEPLNSERPEIDLGRAYVGPQGVTLLDGAVTLERWVAVKEGKALIFALGDIRYTDIFGEHHHTTFRWVVGGKYGLPGEAGALSVAEEGNTAD